jgi:hypothetical protein
VTVILWLTATTVFAVAGYRVADRLAGDAFGFVEKIAAAYLLSAFALYLAVSAIGPYFLDWRTVVIVLGGLLLAGLFGVRQTCVDACAWWREFSDCWSAEPFLSRAILAVAVGLALSSLLQGMAPPNTFDSLYYHLPLAKYDVEAGRMEV